MQSFHIGSSPRVWGQEGKNSFAVVTGRIIPTRVGTRGYASNHGDPEKDHPHACGDKKDDQYLIVSAKGSSPRVWGQATKFLQFARTMRIIPTRVGTSSGGERIDQHLRDHPHACGDKNALPDLNSKAIGSSPRVWGQVRVFHRLF